MKSKFLSLPCLPAPWLVSPETNSIFCRFVLIHLVYSSSDSLYLYHAFRLFPIGSGEPWTLLVSKPCSEAPWGAAADSQVPLRMLELFKGTQWCLNTAWTISSCSFTVGVSSIPFNDFISLWSWFFGFYGERQIPCANKCGMGKMEAASSLIHGEVVQSPIRCIHPGRKELCYLRMK